MTAHPPPVPPTQRSDKGPDQPNQAATPKQPTESKAPDPKADRFGAVKQNTRNQGYQQDR